MDNLPLILTRHASERLTERGGTPEELEETVRSGETTRAKQGRLSFKKNFPFHAEWTGRFFHTKQVEAIAVEEDNSLVVITVYVYYF